MHSLKSTNIYNNIVINDIISCYVQNKLLFSWTKIVQKVQWLFLLLNEWRMFCVFNDDGDRIKYEWMGDNWVEKNEPRMEKWNKTIKETYDWNEMKT